MEFTNDLLLDMEQKKGLYNGKFANWYYQMYKDDGGEILSVKDGDKTILLPSRKNDNKYFNRGSRISSCCDIWVWNKYEKNKLMDLQKLNRCMNSRFCPNCKMLNVAKFIHEFKSKSPDLSVYDLYMLTLTIPSCECNGEVLDLTIRKLNDVFHELNRKFSSPLFTPTGKPSAKALQDRLFTMVGGVKVLEITYNFISGFHPHFHIIVCVPKGSVKSCDVDKCIEGKWSDKRKSFNMKSNIDIQLGKVWTMLWYGIHFRKYDCFGYYPKETYCTLNGQISEFKCLEVDFVPLDDSGLYEVFKYTFKSSDVQSYDVFKALVQALAYKRIRQGFGCLYDLNCDDDNDGELQSLNLDLDETPVEIMTRDFRELVTTFGEYRKISRFNPAEKDIVNNFVKNIIED